MWGTTRGFAGGTEVMKVAGRTHKLTFGKQSIGAMAARCIKVALLTVAAVSLMTSAVTAASDSLANLGGPTAAAPGPPTGYFRYVRTTLRAHGKPEVLFLGTEGDGWSAAERWPVVKALGQFGTWSNLGMASSVNGPTANDNFGKVVTFDWMHARFRSRYVAFIHKDMFDVNKRPLQKLSSRERALLHRYAPISDPTTTALWPLVMVGGYAMHGTAVPPGEFQDYALHQYSFQTVQGALQRGLASYDPLGRLTNDINTETNVITALICHADGLRPAKACGRPVIKAILRHVK